VKIDALSERDLMIIQGALVAQAKYHRALADRAKEPEAKIRNIRNLEEVRSLMGRLERAARASFDERS
jgi:hypothetical protein